MCGLIGAFVRNEISMSPINRALENMHARGPDASGVFEGNGVYLGHRRLAIMDLDARSNQPLRSTCGRYVIVFNGEIYNFHGLREGLESNGVIFKTNSDTEILVELFKQYGAEMLGKLHGMFAFIIWDIVECKAFVARDPYGIKPLYIAKISDGILIASQVKALTATGLVSGELSPEGQAGFWMLGSVPEPYTWFQDIQEVPAGHYFWVQNSEVTASHCWNDIGYVWQSCPPSINLSDSEIENEVRLALRESVKRHLVSDVPVGIFLSGGIDSGVLAGLMVEVGVKSLKAVTITFEEFSGTPMDESPIASEIAGFYGIEHHVRRVSKEEFIEDYPKILEAMDQPTVDGINTWYASKAIAELGIKVAMSGVGGDELFLGYESFIKLPRLVKEWKKYSKYPGVKFLAHLFCFFQYLRTSKSRWRYAPEWAKSIAGAWWLRRSIHTFCDLKKLMKKSNFQVDANHFSVESYIATKVGKLSDAPELALAQIESVMYLRNQLLRDSDWASMCHSVELRTPFVDAHLLSNLKPFLSSFRRFPNKALLAQAPLKMLPYSIISRSKTGFGTPIQKWLTELNDEKAANSSMNMVMWKMANAYK